MAAKVNWKEEPDDRDYPAAENYLSLVVSPAAAEQLAARLRRAKISHSKAKDLLRASRLPLLPPGRLAAGVVLTIADGYHRVCASYHLSEDEDIPCRIVDAPRS
jgi:hypothetical protein